MSAFPDIQFGEPTENHTVRFAPREEAATGRPRGFTDKALDAYTLQELLDLRTRVESRLPVQRLRDMDLERELVLQVLALQQLQANVIDDDDTPANQKAQVANSLSAALTNLIKLQSEVCSSERRKVQENVLMDTINTLPEETARQFFDEYARALSEAFARWS